MPLEFTKVSRWMYVADGYVVRWDTVRGGWRVKAPDGTVVGETGREVEDAKLVANFHAFPDEYRPPPIPSRTVEIPHLTERHGDVLMVERSNDDDKEPSTMKNCQCLVLTGDSEGDTLVAKPCTEQVPDKRDFKPGHDAKLKSVLLKAYRTGDAIVIVDGSTRTEAVPSILAADRGWSQFMKPAPARKPRKAKADGKDNTGVDHADDQPDVEPGVTEPAGMSMPARVKVRGAWKDGVVTKVVAGDTASDPQTMTVAYTNGKGKTVSTTLKSNSDKLELL